MTASVTFSTDNLPSHNEFSNPFLYRAMFSELTNTHRPGLQDVGMASLLQKKLYKKSEAFFVRLFLFLQPTFPNFAG